MSVHTSAPHDHDHTSGLPGSNQCGAATLTTMLRAPGLVGFGAGPPPYDPPPADVEDVVALMLTCAFPLM